MATIDGSDLAADMMEAAAGDRDAMAPQKQSYRLSKVESREQAARKLERKRLRRIQEEEQMRMEEEQYNNFGRGGGMAPQRVGTPAQFQRPLGSWVQHVRLVSVRIFRGTGYSFGRFGAGKWHAHFTGDICSRRRIHC